MRAAECAAGWGRCTRTAPPTAGGAGVDREGAEPAGGSGARGAPSRREPEAENCPRGWGGWAGKASTATEGSAEVRCKVRRRSLEARARGGGSTRRLREAPEVDDGCRESSSERGGDFVEESLSSLTTTVIGGITKGAEIEGADVKGGERLFSARRTVFAEKDRRKVFERGGDGRRALEEEGGEDRRGLRGRTWSTNVARVE